MPDTFEVYAVSDRTGFAYLRRTFATHAEAADYIRQEGWRSLDRLYIARTGDRVLETI